MEQVCKEQVNVSLAHFGELHFTSQAIFITCSIKLICWMITRALLSSALLLAAASHDPPTDYNEPVDYFRAVCEGLILLVITIRTMRDIMLLFM